MTSTADCTALQRIGQIVLTVQDLARGTTRYPEGANNSTARCQGNALGLMSAVP